MADSDGGAAPNGDDPTDAAGTTRERIADALRDRGLTAAELSPEVGVPESAVYDHVEHVAQSVNSAEGEQFLVAPPECRDCGFDRFDDRLGRPSRCPDCRSERIAPPAFRIDDA